VPETKGLEQSLLEEKKYFDLVLKDGERLTCKYLGGSKYNLHLETMEAGTILLYKHSIEYVVLEPGEEEESDVILEAMEIFGTQEDAVSV
jgi:sRNA-binding regulator protein Hfq